MSEQLSVADVLERAADLVAPEGAWARGSMGDCTSRFCAWAAIIKASGGAQDVLVGAVAVADKVSRVGIVTYNDTLKRTQAEVVAKLREAAAKAREQGE
jgi:hypothetical protein